MRPVFLDRCRENIDAVLLTSGAFIGIGLPLLLFEQWQNSHVSNPLLRYCVAAFAVSGAAKVYVGVRGLFNCYQSIEHRLQAFLKAVGLLAAFAVVCYIGWFAIAAFCEAWPAISNRMSNAFGVIWTLFHVAVACLGGMAGFHLATLRPPPSEGKIVCFTALGGLCGFCLAPIALVLMLVIGISIAAMKWLQPNLPAIIQRAGIVRQSQRSLPPPDDATANTQVADLRRQVQWTKDCGAPQHFRDEEVSRLEQQIRDLGGTL